MGTRARLSISPQPGAWLTCVLEQAVSASTAATPAHLPICAFIRVFIVFSPLKKIGGKTSRPAWKNAFHRRPRLDKESKVSIYPCRVRSEEHTSELQSR